MYMYISELSTKTGIVQWLHTIAIADNDEFINEMYKHSVYSCKLLHNRKYYNNPRPRPMALRLRHRCRTQTCIINVGK